MPSGTFFLYVKAPKSVAGGPSFDTAEDFSQYLITTHLISTVPWDNAGGYVRFSVTYAAKGEQEEVRIMSEIKKRLSSITFEF